MRGKKEEAEKEKKRRSGNGNEAKKRPWTCNPKFQQKTMQEGRKPLRWKGTQGGMRAETSRWPLLSMWDTQRCHTVASATQLRMEAHRRKHKFLVLPSRVSSYSELKLIVLVAKEPWLITATAASSDLVRWEDACAFFRRERRATWEPPGHTGPLFKQRGSRPFNYHLLFASFFLEGETKGCRTGLWELWLHKSFQFGTAGQFFYLC